MAKKQKGNKKPPVAKVSLQELKESRDGGQIALRGYSYQFLYSCNLILSSDTDTVFTLEGIEDIDTVKCSDGNETITHTVLLNFPLFCPKCKRENKVNVIKLKMVESKEPDV